MRALSPAHRIASRLLVVTLLVGGAAALPTTAFAQVSEASPATDLTAEANYDEVKLTWANPVTPDFSGTVVRGKAGSVAPSGPEDGFAVTPDLSIAPSATAIDLEPSTPYTFAVFAKNLAGEFAPPATVTMNAYSVSTTVSPDRIRYGKEVAISGSVTDALTGAPVEYAEIRLVAHPLATDEFFVIAEDFTRTGGTYSIPVTPPEHAEFVVVAVGDAQHLAGAAATRAVSVSSAVLVEPVSKNGKLGTTFALIATAVPTHTGLPLILEEKVKGKWKTVLKKKPNKKGFVTFKFTPKTKGKHVYRVSKPSAREVGAGSSRSITIKVT